MRLRCRVYWAQKAGNAEGEYEDAFWPLRDVDARLRGFRCSVSDGATESSYSGPWARMLVRAYCRRLLDTRRRERALKDLGAVWRQDVSAGPLPWYAEQKLEQGAFSSLLGVQFGEAGGWRATAVGDTCLFHVRGSDVVSAFPVNRSADFTNSPALISSVWRHNQGLEEHIRFTCGEWRRGDMFLLMTDAVACWYLCCVEGGCMPDIPRRRTSFRPWLAGLRSSGAVRNDDTTVMRVEML
jgi:hypothetical protein